ncbi:MAG: hypothetical protein LBD23_16720 [Oscillospiraceae bacterium]|jgi:hypothetical protein|nr:hypothetical protein [Oscillospiraceae bacterium]
MGIEYYAFALFVAGLICVIAIICKVLFANVKNQKKLLDERESQVLQLYTSVETLMEEFNDQLKVTTDELKEYEYRATSHITAFDLPPKLEKNEHVLEKLPRTLPFDANRIRVAGEVLERAERIIKSDTIINTPSTGGNGGQSSSPVIQENNDSTAVFQKFFDDSTDASALNDVTKDSSAQSRSEAILALASEGKNEVEIASKLGITRNEVQLVIGLKR